MRATNTIKPSQAEPFFSAVLRRVALLKERESAAGGGFALPCWCAANEHCKHTQRKQDTGALNMLG